MRVAINCIIHKRQILFDETRKTEHITNSMRTRLLQQVQPLANQVNVIKITPFSGLLICLVIDMSG